jgi:hypothetical protein
MMLSSYVVQTCFMIRRLILGRGRLGFGGGLIAYSTIL